VRTVASVSCEEDADDARQVLRLLREYSEVFPPAWQFDTTVLVVLQSDWWFVIADASVRSDSKDSSDDSASLPIDRAAAEVF
jgi:hypothetical protein